MKSCFVNFAQNDRIIDYYSLEEYWRNTDWNNNENLDLYLINKNYNNAYKNTY